MEQSRDPDVYTKRELKLKKNGYIDLAAAVCRQWKLDGMPVSEQDGVELWAELITAYQHHMLSAVHDGNIMGLRRT